jgi:hypothetical protein
VIRLENKRGRERQNDVMVKKGERIRNCFDQIENDSAHSRLTHS